MCIRDRLLAVLLAAAIPWWTNRFRADPPVLRKPALALRFALRVLVDIVVSNIDVARRVLGPEAVLQSRWLWVPLDVRSPAGQAVLAGVVTLTPGTLSSEFSPDRRFLLVHALHCTDEDVYKRQVPTKPSRPISIATSKKSLVPSIRPSTTSRASALMYSVSSARMRSGRPGPRSSRQALSSSASTKASATQGNSCLLYTSRCV